MASKERSPNFPAASLSKCLEYIAKLHGEAKRTPVKTLMALQAMGFNSVSGRSKTVLAALRAYGLVKVVGDTVQVADIGLRILFPKNDEDCSAAKREAAMNPKLFRQIQESRSDLSEKILASELFHEGFTQEGAAKAAQVFHQNRAFTGGQVGSILESENGDENDDGEDDAPPPPPNNQKPPIQGNNPPAPAVNNPPQFQRPMNAEAMLPIPLDIGDAFIPRGMSDDDFQLLLDSLNLWKRRIVRAEWPKHAVWSNADNDQPVTITGPMGEKDGVKYFRSSTGTGIPESELTFYA